MTRHRIAVGLDAGEPARRALWWAVREAARTGAGVLVVTAWPAPERDAARHGEGLVAARVRLQRMQLDRIAEAVAGLDQPPMVARELVLADPVPALRHAARFADLIVIGDDARPAENSAQKSAGSVRKHLPDRPSNTHRDITQPVPTAFVEPPPVRTLAGGGPRCVTAG